MQSLRHLGLVESPPVLLLCIAELLPKRVYLLPLFDDWLILGILAEHGRIFPEPSAGNLRRESQETRRV
jgi:hypothetical protein